MSKDLALVQRVVVIGVVFVDERSIATKPAVNDAVIEMKRRYGRNQRVGLNGCRTDVLGHDDLGVDWQNGLETHLSVPSD